MAVSENSTELLLQLALWPDILHGFSDAYDLIENRTGLKLKTLEQRAAEHPELYLFKTGSAVGRLYLPFDVPELEDPVATDRIELREFIADMDIMAVRVDRCLLDATTCQNTAQLPRMLDVPKDVEYFPVLPGSSPGYVYLANLSDISCQVVELPPTESTEESKNFFDACFSNIYYKKECLERYAFWNFPSVLPEFLFLDADNRIKGISEPRKVGPAFTIHSMGAYSITVDIVFALEGKFWPQMAAEYIQRHRKSGWPGDSLLKKIKLTGCNFVAVGQRDNPRQHSEWRVSFTKAEQMLISLLIPEQRETYILVKALLKLAKKGKNGCELSSYMMKMTLLWLCEEIGANVWQEQTRLQNIHMLLAKLSFFFKAENLPNYFIPSHNMIGRLDKQAIDRVIELVDEVSENIKLSLCNFIDSYIALPFPVRIQMIELHQDEASFVRFCKLNFILMALNFSLHKGCQQLNAKRARDYLTSACRLHGFQGTNSPGDTVDDILSIISIMLECEVPEKQSISSVPKLAFEVTTIIVSILNAAACVLAHCPCACVDTATRIMFFASTLNHRLNGGTLQNQLSGREVSAALKPLHHETQDSSLKEWNDLWLLCCYYLLFSTVGIKYGVKVFGSLANKVDAKLLVVLEGFVDLTEALLASKSEQTEVKALSILTIVAWAGIEQDLTDELLHILDHPPIPGTPWKGIGSVISVIESLNREPFLPYLTENQSWSVLESLARMKAVRAALQTEDNIKNNYRTDVDALYKKIMEKEHGRTSLTVRLAYVLYLWKTGQVEKCSLLLRKIKSVFHGSESCILTWHEYALFPDQVHQGLRHLTDNLDCPRSMGFPVELWVSLMLLCCQHHESNVVSQPNPVVYIEACIRLCIAKKACESFHPYLAAMVFLECGMHATALRMLILSLHENNKLLSKFSSHDKLSMLNIPSRKVLNVKQLLKNIDKFLHQYIKTCCNSITEIQIFFEN